MKKRSEKMEIVTVTNTLDMLNGPGTLALLSDIRSLIEAARRRVSTTVNVEMVLIYWHIGNRILKDILGMERADYGKQIVQTLSGKLKLEYGRGYSRTNLFHMIKFAEVFSDLKIVQTLTGQLGWSHFVQIIALDDPLKRDFYAEICRIERWSTRTLHTKIQGMLYERTALSKKSEKLIKNELTTLREEDRMTPDLVFRDCAEKTTEHVELLQLETSGIRVAEYLTELPPRPLLEAKLHEAIRLAREQIAAHEVPRLEGAK